MSRTGSQTPPVGDCSSSWLLWQDEKRLRLTSKRPTAETRLNVISIRDQHTTELGFVITTYMMSRGCELTPFSCSRAAPSAPDIADTDKEDIYKSCYSCGTSNQNICWWHWLMACDPHTTQPTTQISLPQVYYHLSAVANVSIGSAYIINIRD